MNQASAPWPSHIHGCCSDLVVRERKVLRALFLIAFLSSVFEYCIVFCLSSADCRRRRIEKMEFPDVSSFPCPSPYRGCGEWPFGNRIHHLMRSFHSSIINITEVSISRPPGKKILKNYFSVLQGFAQLLSGEGACVTCFSSRPLSS